MNASVTLQFPPGECEVAAAVGGALSPESCRAVPRTSARVAVHGSVVRIELDAADAAALRAGLNSYLRWADVAAGAAELARSRRKNRGE